VTYGKVSQDSSSPALTLRFGIIAYVKLTSITDIFPISCAGRLRCAWSLRFTLLIHGECYPYVQSLFSLISLLLLWR